MTLPVTNSAMAAGTKVTDNSMAPSKAMTTVKAIGWNILPSTPLRAKIGRYTTMMINWPKINGRRASLAAAKTSWKRSDRVSSRP
ncbi:hypothetical protein D3C73_977680 [compost metagenome]